LSDFTTNKSSNDINYVLAMKTKVYSPFVQKTCRKFNDSMSRLIDEIAEYVKIKKENDSTRLSFLTDNPTEREDSEPFSLTTDNDAILKFSQATCIESLTETIKSFSKLPTGNSLEQVIIFNFTQWKW